MKIKHCNCCNKHKTTKEVVKIGRNELGLWVNCRQCNSTMLLVKKEDKLKYGISEKKKT